MTREELVLLGKKIVNCEGSESQISEWVDLFNQNVPHPDGAMLFYYPENYKSRRDNIAEYNPTVEEIVDKVLAYKPFML